MIFSILVENCLYDLWLRTSFNPADINRFRSHPGKKTSTAKKMECLSLFHHAKITFSGSFNKKKIFKNLYYNCSLNCLPLKYLIRGIGMGQWANNYILEF